MRVITSGERPAHARQRRRKSFERRSLKPAAQRARFQQAVAARRRNDDRHERRRELHAAIRGERPARRRIRLRDGRSRYDRPGTRRRNVFEFQRRCDSGSAVQLRRHVGGHRARRRGIYQRRHQIRERLRAWQRIRIRAQRGVRCAQLFRPQQRHRSAPHSSVCAQRVRRDQRRPDRAAENLRRPRQDILFRRVSRIPPGPRHDAGICRPDRGGTPRHRHHDGARRHAVRSGQRKNRVDPRALSAAQRTVRPLRRSNVCRVFQGRHQYRSILDSRRSQNFRQSESLYALQPEPGERPDDKSRSDGDRSAILASSFSITSATPRCATRESSLRA